MYSTSFFCRRRSRWRRRRWVPRRWRLRWRIPRRRGRFSRGRLRRRLPRRRLGWRGGGLGSRLGWWLGMGARLLGLWMGLGRWLGLGIRSRLVGRLLGCLSLWLRLPVRVWISLQLLLPELSLLLFVPLRLPAAGSVSAKW